MAEIFAGSLFEHADDLRLPLGAMGEVLVDARPWVFDHVAVTRQDLREAELAQAFERREVLDHVAATRRCDHARGAVEHGVAREQRPLLVEVEAEVVRRMPRRVQHLEAELGALDHRALVDEPIGRDDGLILLRDLGVREHLGPGRLHETARCPANGRDGCA